MIDFEKELLSLTVRPEAATLFSVRAVDAALQAAKTAFPEYRLTIEKQPVGGAVVKTDGMRVQRWLRL